MYLGSIPHVSLMYHRTSADTCVPHVSRMYPACISHVSFMYLTCVPPCRCAYLATATGARKGDEEGEDSCRASRPAHWLEALGSQILWAHASTMTRPRYMYRDFVSRCILMYRDEESKIHVSWCILICIQSDIKEAHRIHVSWCILCVSCMYLGLVWDTCKIHAKCQDTCILLEFNRACKIHLGYIRIH